jgi:hypothetical protein
MFEKAKKVASKVGSSFPQVILMKISLLVACLRSLHEKKGLDLSPLFEQYPTATKPPMNPVEKDLMAYVNQCISSLVEEVVDIRFPGARSEPFRCPNDVQEALEETTHFYQCPGANYVSLSLQKYMDAIHLTVENLYFNDRSSLSGRDTDVEKRVSTELSKGNLVPLITFDPKDIRVESIKQALSAISTGEYGQPFSGKQKVRVIISGNTLYEVKENPNAEPASYTPDNIFTLCSWTNPLTLATNTVKHELESLLRLSLFRHKIIFCLGYHIGSQFSTYSIKNMTDKLLEKVLSESSAILPAELIMV